MVTRLPAVLPSKGDLEEERKLIESAQAGNLDAMRPLFEKYSGPLYSAVLMPKIGNPAAAEDVLRETLATAVQKLDTFTWEGKSIFAWLRQIAVNKAYDLHRKNKRGRRLAQAIQHEASAAPQHEPAADAKIMAQQDRAQSRERIEEALGQMNPRYERAIRLRLIEELPREQCAAQMEVTIATFDVVFFRATKAFRKQYGERES